MKYFGMILSVVLLAYASEAPTIAASPTRTLSPRLQLAMRVHDAAKAACLAALTADHRVKILGIVSDFDAGKTDLEAASTASVALLNDDEVRAILEAERTMADTMTAAWTESHGETPLPPRLPILFNRALAGHFLIRTLGEPGVVWAQTETPFPVPSASPR